MKRPLPAKKKRNQKPVYTKFCNQQSMKRRKLILLGAALILLAGLTGGIYQWVFAGLPSLDNIRQSDFAPSIRITGRNGELLYEMLPGGEGRYRYVSIDQIPPALQQATVSTEDASFYTNPGVDLGGIIRAVWINVTGGETLSGGSTITQQVARLALFSPEERYERTLRRKIREAVLAYQLTQKYSKDEILELYLNQTYYGGMAYGVEAAAQTYFGKPVSELDLAECALIAGLAQTPGVYNPFTNPEAAKTRQQVVLELMVKHGMLSEDERKLADAEILVYTSTPYPIEAPHFVMMVIAELDRQIPAEILQSTEGITVRTTLNLDWQHRAEQIARRQLEFLNNPPAGEVSHNVSNAALVAMDPYTGEVLALVGSPDYFDVSISGAINMAIAPVQPGSALKPLIYAAALNPVNPAPWTAATMILDVRTAFATQTGEPYVPANYDATYHGPVLVRDALGSSLNIPAVATLEHVGLEDAIALSQRMGITTLRNPSEYDLSLALGGGAVRLIDLTAAYGALANGGSLVTPVLILEVTGADGEILLQPEPPARPRVLDPRLAWLITDILSDDNARLIGFGMNSPLKLDRPAAAKTGTTTDFHDNWTLGYTPDLVVGVWVGNASHEPMREVSGISGAGPIWHQFMRSVLEGTPETSFTRPEGLVQVEVCALSGLLPSADCPYTRLEWFIDGTQPLQEDNLYQVVVLDARTGLLADDAVPPEQRIERIVLDLPPQAASWAHTQGLSLYSDFVHTETTTGIPLVILSPDPNAVFRLTPDLPLDGQRLQLAASAALGLRDVRLFLDGQEIARFEAAPYTIWWTLEIGEHELWAEALNELGERVLSQVVTFTVR